MCRSSLVVGERAPPSARRRATHDHTAALTGRFASRQHRSLARPVRDAAVFGVPMAEPCVLRAGCRVPWGAKEPRTTRPREDTMTADALKKITTDALDKLAALLDEGRSDRLTALLKTMGTTDGATPPMPSTICFRTTGKSKSKWAPGRPPTIFRAALQSVEGSVRGRHRSRSVGLGSWLVGLGGPLAAPLAVQGQAPESGLFPFDKYSSAYLLFDAIREDIRRRWRDNIDAWRHLMLLPRTQVVSLKTSGKRVTEIELRVNDQQQFLRPPLLSPDCTGRYWPPAPSSRPATRYRISVRSTTAESSVEPPGSRRGWVGAVVGHFGIR